MHFFGLKVRLHSRNRWKRFSKALSCSVWSLPKTMESSRMSGVIHCFVKNIFVQRLFHNSSLSTSSYTQFRKRCSSACCFHRAQADGSPHSYQGN